MAFAKGSVNWDKSWNINLSSVVKGGVWQNGPGSDKGAFGGGHAIPCLTRNPGSEGLDSRFRGNGKGCGGNAGKTGSGSQK